MRVGKRQPPFLSPLEQRKRASSTSPPHLAGGERRSRSEGQLCTTRTHTRQPRHPRHEERLRALVVARPKLLREQRARAIPEHGLQVEILLADGRLDRTKAGGAARREREERFHRRNGLDLWGEEGKEHRELLRRAVPLGGVLARQGLAELSRALGALELVEAESHGGDEALQMCCRRAQLQYYGGEKCALLLVIGVHGNDQPPFDYNRQEDIYPGLSTTSYEVLLQRKHGNPKQYQNAPETLPRCGCHPASATRSQASP